MSDLPRPPTRCKFVIAGDVPPEKVPPLRPPGFSTRHGIEDKIWQSIARTEAKGQKNLFDQSTSSRRARSRNERASVELAST